VPRGQPSGGFVFCQDFSSGLSDHRGVKDGFWRMEFAAEKACHRPFAATAIPFSTYLIGACIDRLLTWRFGAGPCRHKIGRITADFGNSSAGQTAESRFSVEGQ
jgi:hypothetical protein